jgi:hypothetical protein
MLSTVLAAATPLWLFGGFAVAFALWTPRHPAALAPPDLRGAARRR